MATDSKSDKPEMGGSLSLGAIDAKIAALQELRESILRAVSVGALGQPGDIDLAVPSPAFTSGGRSDEQPLDLPTGAFMNKSMPEAIKLLYMATKRKWIPKDVAAALREGGYESTSRNFDGTVTGTMYRMKDQGILLKFKDGFGLAELYPEHLRAKIAEGSKPAPKIRVRRPAKAAEPEKATQRMKRTTKKPQKTARPRHAPKTGLEARIMAYLRTAPVSASLVPAIAEALDANLGTVRMTLGRMRRNHKVSRNESGVFELIAQTEEPKARAS